MSALLDTYRGPVTIEIIHNATGEVRTETRPEVWGDGSYYWWTEGNASCDCNRTLIWERLGHEEDTDYDDLRCGDGTFTIRVVLPDGSWEDL